MALRHRIAKIVGYHSKLSSAKRKTMAEGKFQTLCNEVITAIELKKIQSEIAQKKDAAYFLLKICQEYGWDFSGHHRNLQERMKNLSCA